MTIPDKLNKVEIFYDGQCGMCCTFHEWVNEQDRAFEVDFIPYQSERAKMEFAEIMALDPEKEMIVRTDEGEIFRGAEGWVLCLYSCTKYQKYAQKLSGPLLLPLAMKACHLLAANRRKLSKVFFAKKEQVVAQELHEMRPPKCKDATCKTGKD